MNPITRTWRIDALHHCVADVVRTPTGALELVVRWLPRMPRRVTARQIDAYLEGRARALRELETAVGARLLLRPQI